MEKDTIDKINSLKAELQKDRDNIQNISELIKREIDRDFPVDLWELSDKELDAIMGDRLSVMNDNIDTRPVPSDIQSHRGLSGKVIVRIKKFLLKLTSMYTNTLFDRQRELNSQLVFYHLASFIRQRRLEEKMDQINRTIKELSENQFFQSQSMYRDNTDTNKKDTDDPTSQNRG